MRQQRLDFFHQTIKATLLIRKRSLGSFDPTANANIPIKRLQLDSFDQTDEAWLIQSNNIGDSSDQTVQTWPLSSDNESDFPYQKAKAWLIRLDSKGHSSDTVQTWLLRTDKDSTLFVRQERHVPFDQTPKAWPCKLPVPDLKETPISLMRRRMRPYRCPQLEGDLKVCNRLVSVWNLFIGFENAASDLGVNTFDKMSWQYFTLMAKRLGLDDLWVFKFDNLEFRTFLILGSRALTTW